MFTDDFREEVFPGRAQLLINVSANRKSGFSALAAGGPLFKRRMISCELPREFFAEGRIPDEFLKFTNVNAP
jgi:hypothetical protein